jgi:outer membrane protein OmpA-like peptidoglycan-associated protein
MKRIFALAIISLFMCAHEGQAQEDTSEAELQGILDAFEDDKSESVEGMKVDLKSIQFQTGTDKLVSTDTKYIDRILDYFKSLPTVLLVIEGHTDNVGNKKSNQILSEKRALAVKNYLVQIGVSADRIKTVGFGSTLPIATNDTDEGRKQNRRVELKFSGVSNEIHTINLVDGTQVQAQFVMINRDGSIGYKETLKSPMKKLKAPEIRNIAFHNGTNFVPKDDPTVIRKTEAAAAIAQRAAEDPSVKEQELKDKKMREELLLKEQQLREQQLKEQELKEQQERDKKLAEQSGKRNSIGFSALGSPNVAGTSAKVISFEFEHFSNEKNSIAVRVEYLGYSDDNNSSGYTETGDGIGVGFSFKHFFSSKPYQGFYIGPAIEVGVFRASPEIVGGKSTMIGIIPNLIAGYRFNLGNSFSVTPSIMLGYRVGVTMGNAGGVDSQSGPFVGVGGKFSWRF